MFEVYLEDMSGRLFLGVYSTLEQAERRIDEYRDEYMYPPGILLSWQNKSKSPRSFATRMTVKREDIPE